LAKIDADGLKDVRWFVRTRYADGEIVESIEPGLARANKPRRRLATLVRRARRSRKAGLPPNRDDTAVSDEKLDQLLSELDGDKETVTPGLLEDPAAELESRGGYEALVRELRALAKIESRDHPDDLAVAILRRRVPRFVIFDDDERGLRDEYDLNAVADQPPKALANLAQLAGLNLARLRDAVAQNETGTVVDTIEEANAELRRRFASWTQKPPLTVLLDAHESRLVIHVKSGRGASMRFHERSDGLRQFVALFALTANRRYTVPPILLIDEVEQHLHYDAQADLLRVLHEQTLTSQVIYTTHSAACLPEDLGASMRVVAGVGDEMRSKIRSSFWTEDPGLGALLLALGASSLALVPIRPAVIAEGPSELVLLPSLIKEATGSDSLGYSIVPGASNAPPQRIAGVDLAGVATVWVLDGDQGGRNRKKFLTKHSVPASRILLLGAGGKGLDLEDLIDPRTYVAAVNCWLEDIKEEKRFAVDGLPAVTCARHKALENWCKNSSIDAPGKPVIANKVLSLSGEQRLVAPTRRVMLRALNDRIVGLLNLEAS
jgi:hypothetical protein